MDTQVSGEVISLLGQAKQLADTRDWSAAADICRHALELAPCNINILDNLGWYLSRAKRYGEAIEVFQDLVQRGPQKAKWPYMLGYQYYDQENWGEALRWFARALELRETYLVVLYRKGYAHVTLGETELAKQALQKCITVWRGLEGAEQEREAKHYSDACFQLGKILLESGQSRNAERILLDAVTYGPSDVYKHYCLGKALLRNGKASEALAQFQRAEQLKPGEDFVLVYMARAHMELGHYQEAEANLDRIPVRRRKAYVWHGIGRLRLLQKKNLQAVEALLEATRLEPRNHNQFLTLGQAYEAEGNLATAHRAYARAVELRRRNYDLEFPEAAERLAAVEHQATAEGIDLIEPDHSVPSPDGYVKTYNVSRGFGFISRNGDSDIFFHISDVATPDAVKVGVGVSFEAVDSPKGPRATRVSVI